MHYHNVKPGDLHESFCRFHDRSIPGLQNSDSIQHVAEWNDQYRDTVRKFWRGDPQGAQGLGSALLGTAGVFDQRGRRVWSSVNYAASHDGFTLADLTRYSRRHNLDNGEGGHDGHNANFSDNCGAEGETDDPTVLARRARRQRNLLATQFLSQGTPMLLAGDEIGNSQNGNNNAYCQDNPIGWINWATADDALTDFLAQLSAFRRAYPSLRQSVFLHGGLRPTDKLPDVEWVAPLGGALQWRDPGLSTVGLLLRGSSEVPNDEATEDALYIVFNRDSEPMQVYLPPLLDGHRWMRVLDTSRYDGFDPAPEIAEMTDVGGECVVAFAQRRQDSRQ